MLDPSDGWSDPLVHRLVNLASICHTFNKLPREGGVLEQDALTIIGMMYVLEAQHKRDELERKKNTNRNK